MIRSMLVGVTALMISVYMPVLLLTPQEPVTEERLLIIEHGIRMQEDVTIRLQAEGTVREVPLEEYLIGVLMSEMPMSFEEEALKAQTVAARTFAVRQMTEGKHEDCDLCADSSCCQAWTSSERLRQKLGEACWSKAKNAVEVTAGEVLVYEDVLIDAVYFSCSGGSTEDAVAVWGGSVPYLVSVESPGEEYASPFASGKTFTAAELQVLLPEADLSGPSSEWIGLCRYTGGGGLDTAVIGGHTFRGTELRSRLGLNSTMMKITAEEDGLSFSVKGYGHRVGMSQYGANAMAKNGHSYREILQHYYTGVEIENSSKPS